MTSPLAVLFNTILVIICGFALIRGGKPERIGAIINLTASGLTTFLQSERIVSLAPAELSILVIDTAVAASFFWLGIRTIRFWPVWAFGFALADLVASLAGPLLPHAVLFIYHTILVIYAYLALGALALGTYKLPRDADPVVRNGFRTCPIQHRETT